MNEKQGTAEWLRGIIGECEADKAHCSAIAEMFGIDCWREKTCRDCIARMLAAIAERIDIEMMEKERLKKENAELREMLACWQNYHLNMLARAKKFAGIEEEAQR